MSNYWVRRIKEEENLTFNKSKKLIEDIQETYKKAYKKIKSSIDELEVLIRNNKMELDMLETSKLLTIEEKKELEKSIKETLKGYEDLANSIDYKKYKKDIKEIYKFKSLQNMGYNSRITRLKAKQMEIEAILTSLSKQQDIMLTKHLKEVYEDTYYKTAYINSLQKGSFENINKLDFDGVIKAVKQSWTVDGINFSKRIWKNSAIISKEISKEIIVNIAIGKGVRNLAEKISKKYNVALYQASRLVQTETSAIRNRATLDRYKEEGIEKYQIIAVRDSKTSKICQSMDMKIFNTKDQVIGVNYPPFHINCRSTTKAYFEFLEDVEGTRKARLPDNTIQDIPSKMTYNEWYDKYIKNNPEQLKYEKMNKNKANDLKQFELYKNKFKEYKVPKEFIPKDIDTFTKLKYNIVETEGQQNYEIFKIRDKILNTNWKIHEGKQGKHIKGHNNYKGASYFKEGIDIEKLARENLGRGIIKIDDNGNWTNKEFIKVDNIIGYNVEEQTKLETETNRFSIHYNKKGKIHLVPRRKEE